jgi:hypothetical protein
MGHENHLSAISGFANRVHRLTAVIPISTPKNDHRPSALNECAEHNALREGPTIERS